MWLERLASPEICVGKLETQESRLYSYSPNGGSLKTQTQEELMFQSEYEARKKLPLRPSSKDSQIASNPLYSVFLL